jgi:hypothetical protein
MTDQDDIEASGLRTARCKRIHGEFKPDRLVSERRHFFLVTDQTRLGLEDGLDLLREVRLSSDVPVIIITGHRRDDIDRVVGLELGADDYLTKPFNLRELHARVRAVLRRFGRSTPARDTERGRFRFSGWQLDRKIRTHSSLSRITMCDSIGSRRPRTLRPARPEGKFGAPTQSFDVRTISSLRRYARKFPDGRHPLRG